MVESSAAPYVRSTVVRSGSVSATAMAPAAPRSIRAPADAASPLASSSRTCTAATPRRLHCGCMATVARLDTLSEIREKVLAGERLDVDDGVALLESDDLTALGELADTARRLRGGTDE